MPNKKSKIPYFFLAFFAVFICVDSIYIYLANKSWTGVAIKDSYQKGLDYNNTLNQAKEQQKLGWKAEIKLNSLGNKKAILVVNLMDKRRIPIKNAKVQLKFKRPIQEGYDFKEELTFNGSNYRKTLSFPLKGQWDIELVAQRGTNVFITSKRKIVH